MWSDGPKRSTTVWVGRVQCEYHLYNNHISTVSDIRIWLDFLAYDFGLWSVRYQCGNTKPPRCMYRKLYATAYPCIFLIIPIHSNSYIAYDSKEAISQFKAANFTPCLIKIYSIIHYNESRFVITLSITHHHKFRFYDQDLVLSSQDYRQSNFFWSA